MNNNDDTRARRERLRALRSKYRGVRKNDIPVDPNEPPSGDEDRNGEKSFVPRGPRNRQRFKGQQKGAWAGGRKRIAERMLDFLLEKSPGAKMIPGTPVNKDRLKRVIQFITIRTREDNPPKWVMYFHRILSRSGPVSSVDDVSPDLINQIVHFLRQRVDGENASARGLSPAPSSVLSPEQEEHGDRGADEEARDSRNEDEDTRLSRIEQSVEELREMTGRLFQQFSAALDDNDHLAEHESSDEHDSDGEESGKEDSSSKRKGEGLEDWFDNFVEDL